MSDSLQPTQPEPFAQLKTDARGNRYVVIKMDATKEELEIFWLGFSLALESVNNKPASMIKPSMKPMIGGF